jgi:hypothetical protein
MKGLGCGVGRCETEAIGQLLQLHGFCSCTDALIAGLKLYVLQHPVQTWPGFAFLGQTPFPELDMRATGESSGNQRLATELDICW